MALPAYLTVRGERQGPIAGPLSKDGLAGQILVIGAFHNIVFPRNPRTGEATGQRVHKPFNIVKRVDRTSPLLHMLMCSNELASAEIRFYEVDAKGVEFNYLTISLRKALVVSLELKLPNVLNPKVAHLGLREEVG